MPLINEDIFIKKYASSQDFRDSAVAAARIFDHPARYKVDRESALVVAAELRRYIVDNQGQMNKGFRPWDVAPETMAHLDRKEPWWGFEFETGWKNKASRGKALAFAYDNFDGAMFDGEGEGGFPVEITFMPAEMSKYENGTSDAHRFMQWVNDNPDLIHKGAGNDVGCHLNMSHPYVDSHQKAVALAKFLNRSLYWTVLVNGQRKEMFGRETIYAGFFAQHGGGNSWVEFKGYRTAYTMAEFQRYMKSCAGLQKLVDTWVKAHKKELDYSTKAVTNLYDVSFNGAAPKVVVHDYAEIQRSTPAGAKPLHSRYTFGNL
jgi:hypothetical protein